MRGPSAASQIQPFTTSEFAVYERRVASSYARSVSVRLMRRARASPIPNCLRISRAVSRGLRPVARPVTRASRTPLLISGPTDAGEDEREVRGGG